jgi:hypothetical protein
MMGNGAVFLSLRVKRSRFLTTGLPSIRTSKEYVTGWAAPHVLPEDTPPPAVAASFPVERASFDVESATGAPPMVMDLEPSA